MRSVIHTFLGKILSPPNYANIYLWTLQGTKAVSNYAQHHFIVQHSGVSNTSDHLLVRNSCNVQDRNVLVHMEKKPGAVRIFGRSDCKELNNRPRNATPFNHQAKSSL